MNNINQLINKYYKPEGKNKTANPRRHKHEQTTNKYNKKRKQETNLRIRQKILTQLLQEIPFYINKTQEKQIRYWITQFNKDFKTFHRQASNETIILALIFIQQKQKVPNTKIYKFRISEKYNLTTPIFELIQNRLIFKLMQTTPLQYNQKIILDNNIEHQKRRQK